METDAILIEHIHIGVFLAPTILHFMLFQLQLKVMMVAAFIAAARSLKTYISVSLGHR